MSKSINEITKDSIRTIAEEKGVDPQEYVDGLKAELRSDSRSPRATAELTELINLIVITHQEQTLLKSDMYDFISQFIDAPRDDNGNGRRYIKHYIQQPVDYSTIQNNFIPTGLSETKFDVQFIKFKRDNGQLEDTSLQKCFNATYSTPNMIQYFINGQLDVFIEEQIVGKIGDSVVVFLYDYIMRKISVVDKGKIVNGTSADLFSALTTEVFPHASAMLLNSSTYNSDQTNTNSIDASRKEDLVMLVSPKIKTMLNSNIMSQLFNSKKIDLMDYVGHVHVANNKFTYANGIAQTEATQYVDDSTIIILDKRNYFKCLKMLEVSGEQDYPLNMSKLRVLHLWLASGYLKWGKVFVYKNANLSVSPSSVTP